MVTPNIYIQLNRSFLSNIANSIIQTSTVCAHITSNMITLSALYTLASQFVRCAYFCLANIAHPKHGSVLYTSLRKRHFLPKKPNRVSDALLLIYNPYFKPSLPSVPR